MAGFFTFEGALPDQDEINLAHFILDNNLSKRISKNDPRYHEKVDIVSRVLYLLAGSYNDEGRIKWFERKRSILAGATPMEVILDGNLDMLQLVKQAAEYI